VTVRFPHALVGAVCIGCAASDATRVPTGPALVAAAVVATLVLALDDPRLHRPAVAAALVAVAWAWGSMRLAQLDHSVLAPRIGTFEQALVEVEEPPRAGEFDQRMRALVLRWGTLRTHEPVLLELPLGRAPPQGARLELEGELRAPPGPSNGFDEARWLRRQGIHAVLRGQTWHVVGRRGGVFGAGDGIGRWLARDSAPGLTGDRRDVIEAIVLGRSSGMTRRYWRTSAPRGCTTASPWTG
jgi:hypothetical protein